MIDIYTWEFERAHRELVPLIKAGKISSAEYYQLAIQQLELLKTACPENLLYVSRQAEYYHLDGNLRRAGEQYRRVLESEPPIPLTENEVRLIRKFCPILLITPQECFPLKDFVAIHHPEQPLIGYHLFWEDDFDFPDDYEPCDHEEVWIEYDPGQEVVTKVMTFFHSRVIQSEAAVHEARDHLQRAMIRIEWGKHGSLLKGWEGMKEPLTGISLLEWMKQTYEHVCSGGRVPDHPLKRFWPARFTGTFEDYTNFSIVVDPLKHLDRKPLMFKTRWVNAVLFTQSLLYNFHPKMEWPERFTEVTTTEKESVSDT
jgi:hypothetical protein